MKTNLENKKTYYTVYTALFLLLFFSCFEIYLLLYNKSILWEKDTYEMHYLQFLWFGRWVRNGITTGAFPLWNPALGYGGDFLRSGASLLCNPFNWLSVILPERFAEAGFHFATACKLYLCGLSFSWFGLRRKQSPYAVLCGSVLYTFCAYAYTGLCQSGFLTAMFMLPLLVVGTDELFENKRSALYVLSLSFCALNNFYLTYILAILIIAYCILKWCFLAKEVRTVQLFFRLLGRFILFSAWAAAIATVALLPAALVMSGMTRLEIKQYMPLFYDKDFYSSVYKALITSYNMLHRDSEIGFSVLAVVCVFAFLLSRWSEHPMLRIVFVVMTASLCIPFVGHVMNGFSYIANRWIWAFDFVVAYICVLTIPNLTKIKNRNKAAVVVICFLYILFAYTVFSANGREFMIMSIALMLVSFGLFLYPHLTVVQYRYCMVFLSCITVILPAYFQYSRNNINDFRENIPAGAAYETALESNGMPLLNLVDTSDGTRYNAYKLPTVRNASWLYGVSGMDYYMNMYNSNIDTFHNSIALHTAFYNFSYEGLDRRSELLALLGVNHFFTDADNFYTPAGFDIKEAEMVSAGRHIQAWKPSTEYSLFSLFENTISSGEYETLTPYERQQILLQACVLDTTSSTATGNKQQIDSNTIPYTISFKDGLILQDHLIQVSEGGSALTLSFSPQKDGELYLYFDNLVFDNGRDTSCTLKIEAFSGESIISNMSQSLTVGTKLHHMYGGKHNWLINLGLLPDSADSVRITFRNTGNYSFNSILLYNRSTTSILDNIGQLKKGADQVHLSPDQYSISVDTDRFEFLFAAIPYEKGWRAFDNGNPVDIQRADVAFMAIPLDPGHHEIVFQYHNTALTAGLLISFVFVSGYVLMLLHQHRRAKCS